MLSKKVTISLCLIMCTFLMPTAILASSFDEEVNSKGGILIDDNGQKILFFGKNKVKSGLPGITAVDCDPVVTVTDDGITVTHCGGKEYNSDATKWRASAWTTAVKNNTNVYHYTRARVVNTFFPSIIVEDSGRVWGYSKTTATTNYVEANELALSMRSYWGLNDD